MPIQKEATLTFKIPIELHKKLKIRVIEEGTSMKQIITDFIKEYINGSNRN